MSKDLKNYAGEYKIITSHEYYETVKALPPEKKYSFGIKSIDELTEGFTHGNLISISGYSGHGKTSLSQSISYNLSLQKIKALWISYELSSRQFFNKYKGTDVPLFYLPRKKELYNLDWVEERIIEGIQKHNIKIIFIDHLDYVVPMTTAINNRTEMIGHTMRSLKTMATTYEVVIFLMVHTKQPKDTMAPGLESLKGSSFIAQESDAVFTMHRPTKRGQRDEYEEYSVFNVIKHRDTGSIGQKVKLIMHNKMFYDQISLDEREL